MKLWQLVLVVGFVFGYLSTPLSAGKAKIIQGFFTGLGFLIVYGGIVFARQFLRKSNGKMNDR
jgi:hypothetical protein